MSASLSTLPFHIFPSISMPLPPDTMLARPFEQYDGIKILMKQDEHPTTRGKIRQLYRGEEARPGADLRLFRRSARRCNPRAVVGEVDFLQVFTGYVSPFLQTPWRRGRLLLDGRSISAIAAPSSRCPLAGWASRSARSATMSAASRRSIG